MRKLFTLIIITSFFQPLHAQTNIIPKFIRKMFFEKDSSRRPSLVLVPVITSSPETGLELGGTALVSFYSDTTNKVTHVSKVSGYGTITTKSQTILTLSANYWSPGNKLHLSGSASYIYYPFEFWGIGNATRQVNEDNLIEHRSKINLESEKKYGDFLIGVVAGAFHYKFSDSNPDGIFNTSPQVEDKNGGSTIFAGPSVIFDTRNNNTYTTKGTIVTAYLNVMQGVLGNNNYEGAFFNIEYSGFFAFTKQLMLGFDVQEQSLLGGQSPFYLLPAMGSDEMMRGYYTGRFRDRNFIAGQTELRYRFADRFGVAAFAGTGEVFHTNFVARDLKPDYGGGVRYFFDVQKALSIRMDYGVGEKRPGESRQSGFYVALGESF